MVSNGDLLEVIDWHGADAATVRRIMRRSQVDFGKVSIDVAHWLERIRAEGDKAVLEYSRKFDDPNAEINSFRVTQMEIDRAYQLVDPMVLSAIRGQIEISRAFHQGIARTITKEWQCENVPGVVTGFRVESLEAVGLYVPAGKAPLPTVAQILAVAAQAAGVSRIVVCFPPNEAEAAIIVAAHLAGAHEIYRIGGIAAIGALAFGTETLEAVDKIAGPGNLYVQAAKFQVAPYVGVDMFSGPSEAVIVADETANPEWLAADVLARCEHGPDSAAVVVTTSLTIARRTAEEIARQTPLLKRQEYILEALRRFSGIVVVAGRTAMVDFVNKYRAEHLEIQCEDPEEFFQQVRSAGSTFIGSYAPVAAGDYRTGTNHCLPTGGAAGWASAIGPWTFMKSLQWQKLTKEGLAELQEGIGIVADLEGLDAHRRSVDVRFDGGKVG